MIAFRLRNILKISETFMYILIMLFKFGVSQLFERVTVQENIPLNTVIFDLRPVLERHFTGALSSSPPSSSSSLSSSSSSSSSKSTHNITAFANQQETFWPFILDEFLVRLAKPLDREMICLIQTESLRHPSSRMETKVTSYSSNTNQVCLPGACCQLLHVNIITSPTELPTPFYIQVAVQDVNDNPPRFPPLHTPYIVVREDIKPHEKIWLPQAFDADSVQFSIAEYRAVNWVHGNQSHFHLGVSDSNDMDDDLSGELMNKFTGERHTATELGRPYLTITEELDREAIDLYSFTLIAIDGGGNNNNNINTNLPGSANKALTGSVSIIIKISDVNDNSPTFEQNTYRAEVAENSVNSPIIEFNLIDRDIGDNGRVTIIIDDPSGQAQQLFRITLQPSQNPNSKIYTHPGFMSSHSQQMNTPATSHYKGSLQVIGPLDAEKHQTQLRFHLIASDHGQPVLNSRCEIQINIININDNPPKIVFLNNGKRLSDGRISLPEVETPQRAIVALVHVTDDDSPTEQIRCHLIKEDDTFSFEETGGINFLTQQQNQQPFSLFSETIGIHSTYKQFVIRTKKVLDREEKSFYSVTVECIDDEGPYALSRNASLHITITDVNEHKPIFTKSVYNGQVIENQLHAEVHMTIPIQASDADLGVNALITYSLLSPNESSSQLTTTSVTTSALTSQSSSSPSMTSNNYLNGTAFFRIDPITAKIWTIQSLDCENRSEYHLIVVAKDSGVPVSLSSSASVIITVEDANDNVPEFVNTHYLFEVPENAPSGTEIGIVQAMDKDVTIVNQRVRYNLRGSTEDLKLITIDRTTGILRTRRPIDRESRSSISLVVEAENEVPIHRSPSMRSDNLNMLMKHIGTEASVVITILNLNDNRPEFTLIEPHRSHVTFTWEQLNPLVIPKSAQTNNTSGSSVDSKSDKNQKIPPLENANPVCEPLPHRVIDRDMESDTMLDCCILELLDNYNGLFALIPQAPSVLCAMYRPPSPQTYKLTLIAKDGLTNDSLSSQVHFTVIIRSDPNLRISDKSANPRLSHQGAEHLTGHQSNYDYPNSNEDPLRKHFTYDENDQLGKDYLYRSTNIDGNINNGLLYSQSGSSASQQYKSSHSKPIYGYGQQTLIIIVMASIAGVLCVLLLVAIILTKRCAFDTASTTVTASTTTKEFMKEEQNNQNDNTIGMKSACSTGSTPSKTMTFNTFPVNIHHVHQNPDYYAKEMIYHHPMEHNSNEASYDISLENMKVPSSSTLLNNYTAFVPSNPGPTNNHLHGTAIHSPLTRTLQCRIPVEDSLFHEQKCTLIKPVNSVNSWSPPPSQPPHSLGKNHTYMQVNLNNTGSIPAKTSLQKTSPNDTYSQSVYQTIDTRLIKIPHLNASLNNAVCITNAVNAVTPTLKRDHSGKSHVTNSNHENNNNNSSKVHFNKTKTTLLLKENVQQTNDNLKISKNTDPETSETNESLLRKPLLQRANSERSPYFQTSFV